MTVTPSSAGSSLPAPHPRFRARRIAIRRQAGRRRLHRLVALLVLGLLAVGTVGVVNSAVLDVDHVDVAGTRRTHPDEIRAALGVERGDAMVNVDAGAAEARLESLPWVAEASVHRSYPNTVRVEVVERRPVAVVAGAGGSMLVDHDGRVLGAATDPVASPPLLRVLTTTEIPVPGAELPASLASALWLAEELRADGPVAAIRVDEELHALLEIGGRARFGTDADLAEKVEALRLVLGRVDLTCLDTIDLRVPARPVLTRLKTCS